MAKSSSVKFLTHMISCLPLPSKCQGEATNIVVKDWEVFDLENPTMDSFGLNFSNMFEFADIPVMPWHGFHSLGACNQENQMFAALLDWIT